MTPSGWLQGVDDLLDVTRIATGKMALRPEPATIQSVISAAVETVLPAIRAARHEFELLLRDEPLWLNVDADRIAQVIGNLLTNAAKYTPAEARSRWLLVIAALNSADGCATG